MKLSQRALNLKPSSTLAVTARAKSMRKEGLDVLSFAAGEPDFDTPSIIKSAAADALSAGLTKYVASQGDVDARKAIARKIRESNGIEGVEAEHIIISNGGKMCLYLASQALIDPGRNHEVILPTPCWVSYAPQTILAGGVVAELPTTPETNFKMTPEQLRGALNERSRLLFLNSPSNPCGTMYSRDELAELGQVVVEHNRTGGDVTVLSDEIYEHIILGDTHFASFAAANPDVAPYTVTINGLSKAYSMTGWRVGYAACPPTDEGVALVKAMTRLQAQITTCISSFIYPAIEVALASADADVEQMQRAFTQRGKLAYELLRDVCDCPCPEPMGAFYLFPDVSAHFGKTSAGGAKIDSALSFADALLAEKHVAVVPGEDFGGCGDKHIRLSFACSEEQIREGMKRLREFVEGMG
jgi:aspartate aminotransferase